MLKKETAIAAIEEYKSAWEGQDSNKILTIFTEDATYRERAYEKHFHGHDGIKKYWEEKVVRQQQNIKFNLLNLYIDADTAIAEWEVEFDCIPSKKRKQIKEVAILVFEGLKISSLREYWSSRVLDV